MKTQFCKAKLVFFVPLCVEKSAAHFRKHKGTKKALHAAQRSAVGFHLFWCLKTVLSLSFEQQAKTPTETVLSLSFEQQAKTPNNSHSHSHTLTLTLTLKSPAWSKADCRRFLFHIYCLLPIVLMNSLILTNWGLKCMKLNYFNFMKY